MRFFKPLDYMGVGHSDNGSYYNLAWGPLPCMAFTSPIILLSTFKYWYKLQLQLSFLYNMTYLEDLE